MRPDCVAVKGPGLDDGLGPAQAEEGLAIEQFAPQASVNSLDIAVLVETGVM